MKSLKNQKVVVIHNTISPHILPVFAALAKKLQLTVLFCSLKESNRTWSEKPKDFRYEVLENVKIELKNTDLFTLFINTGVSKKLKKLQPDLVIIAGWDLPAYYIAAVYCKFKKIPYIVWSGSTKHELSWRRTVTKPLVQALLRGAAGYIAYGMRARNYLLQLGCRADKVHIAYNSVKLENYNKPTKQQKKFASTVFKKFKLLNKQVVLFYGQLIERKNPGLLVSAVAQLQKEYPRLALLLVGSGTLKKALQEQIIAEDIKHAVVIDDPGDQNMPGLFAAADIFVLPSKEEVWGLVVNQAMAAKLPVIVSDRAGCVDDLVIPGFTGLVFASGNLNSLKDSLKQVVSDKALAQKLGRTAQKRISMTAPKKVATQILELITLINAKANHHKITSSVATDSQTIVKLISLPTITDECSLTFAENPLIPFVPKRIYYIYEASTDWPRGFHAHHKTQQILFCLRGSITVVLEDGKRRETVTLDKPNVGVLLEPYIWHEMHDFKKDTILLVLASENYDPDDYIRDYNEFRKVTTVKEFS